MDRRTIVFLTLMAAVLCMAGTTVWVGGKKVVTADSVVVEENITIGGDVSADNVTVTTLVDAASIQTVDAVWDCTLGSDHSYCGEVVSATVDSNTVGFGGCLILGTDSHYDDCDADAVATTKARAVALESGTGTKLVLLTGRVRDDSWTWATVGGDLYVSTTANEFTQTAPSGSGDGVKRVGHAFSATVVEFYPRATAVVEIP